MKEDKQEHRGGRRQPQAGQAVSRPVKKRKGGKAPGEEPIAKEALAELRKKAAERDEFLELTKRARADLINYQKRVERDKATLRRFALSELLLELVSFVDDLQRAIAAAHEHPRVKALLEGVEMLEDKLGKLLEQRGVKVMETLGKQFDPGCHEAVAQEENDEHPDLTVVEELQKGYVIHDRVLRPARVKVSRRRTTPQEELVGGPGNQAEPGQSENKALASGAEERIKKEE